MNTTKHNHIQLGTPEKPLIPNLILKETLDSLQRGETDFYELVKEEYTFEAGQQRFVDSFYRKYILKESKRTLGF